MEYVLLGVAIFFEILASSLLQKQVNRQARQKQPAMKPLLKSRRPGLIQALR